MWINNIVPYKDAYHVVFNFCSLTTSTLVAIQHVASDFLPDSPGMVAGFLSVLMK